MDETLAQIAHAIDEPEPVDWPANEDVDWGEPVNIEPMRGVKLG